MAEPAVVEEVPLDQEVHVELETPVVGEKVETKAPKEEESELVKRIKEQSRAEGIQEEAKRQQEIRAKEEAERAKERETWQQEQANLQARANQSDYDSLINALGAAQAERAAAINDIKRAREAGDTEAELEADERRINAVTSIREFERVKTDYEGWMEQQKTAPQPQRQVQQPVVQQDPVEKAIVGLAPAAQTWFRQHPDYVTDPRKNAKVKNLHYDALEAGHELLSTGYFEYVESHLGMRANGQNGQQRVSTMAPVSREAPGSAPLNQNSIRLSVEQREMAWASRLSDKESRADAEKRYAQNLLKLINAKKNGEVQ